MEEEMKGTKQFIRQFICTGEIEGDDDTLEYEKWQVSLISGCNTTLMLKIEVFILFIYLRIIWSRLGFKRPGVSLLFHHLFQI